MWWCVSLIQIFTKCQQYKSKSVVWFLCTAAAVQSTWIFGYKKPKESYRALCFESTHLPVADCLVVIQWESQWDGGRSCFSLALTGALSYSSLKNSEFPGELAALSPGVGRRQIRIGSIRDTNYRLERDFSNILQCLWVSSTVGLKRKQMYRAAVNDKMADKDNKESENVGND